MGKKKTEIKKGFGQIFLVTIAYLKEDSKIRDKFFKIILTQKEDKHIFWLQNGGSSYTWDRLIHG